MVEPKTETFKAAAAGADWSKSFYQILTNEPGKDAWPIVGATFVLLHTTQDKAAQGTETLKFFDWAFKNGTQAANDLDYISLPDSVVAEIRHAVEGEGQGRVGQGSRRSKRRSRRCIT